MARKTNSSYFSPPFFKFEGDSLKRPPIGFNANYEFIKDLMLKFHSRRTIPKRSGGQR